MKRDEFLRRLEEDRAEWDALFAEIDEERMNEPIRPEGWTAKDVLAHVGWYENEMVGVLAARALVGSELWDLPLEERNRILYETYRDRPASEVIAQEHRAYNELLAALRQVRDEDLEDSRRFPGMPEDWIPAEVIASNCYEHYRAHLPALREWWEATRQTS
jgi:hypothetical protein